MGINSLAGNQPTSLSAYPPTSSRAPPPSSRTGSYSPPSPSSALSITLSHPTSLSIPSPKCVFFVGSHLML